jgi:hypothetical protein
LETLIAFSFHYRADNSHIACRMDSMEQFYTRPLQQLQLSRLARVHRPEDDRLVQGISVPDYQGCCQCGGRGRGSRGRRCGGGTSCRRCGASGVFRMSPPSLPPSEGEGGEDGEDGVGPGVRDGDILAEGKAEEDNVTAAAAADARSAANAAAALRGPEK